MGEGVLGLELEAVLGLGLGPGLRRTDPEVLMGMRSWRCWRETEICRAMETFARALRRAWVSASVWEPSEGRDFGDEEEMVVVMERMGSCCRVGESMVSALG